MNGKQWLAIACSGFMLFACQGPGDAQKNTADTTQNGPDMRIVDDQWLSLFDGETTEGWHTYRRDTVGSAWSVQDGALTFNPEVPQEGRGDIVTDREFENFELELEWKIGSGGNSGIFIGVKEDEQYGNTYSTGIEMQVLDNISAADNKIDNHLAGTMYDLIGTPELSKPKPLGEWNQVRIRKKDGQVTMWLNGIQTADVTVGSEEWQSLLEKSKFKDWEGFAKYPKGKIGLQDHGDPVSFRNIRIMEL